MRQQPPTSRTWDGAPSLRTWDIWTHSYLILGLAGSASPFSRRRDTSTRRARSATCAGARSPSGGIDITELGNHHGMSATVLLDPAVELYFATGEARYLELAQLVLAPGRSAIRNCSCCPPRLPAADAAEIATGKAYQLCWNLVGLAKLHRATGDASLPRAGRVACGQHPRAPPDARRRSVGRRGHRSREVFNPAGVFSPHGYVETCSTLAWIQLNRELLDITGEARYAEEIERSAYNDLLGAQAPDGEDWCYYSFPNGRRVHTTYWRCCKSSGAMALEELPGIAYAVIADGDIAVNLYGPGSATLAHPGAGNVGLEQETALSLRRRDPHPGAAATPARIRVARAHSGLGRTRRGIASMARWPHRRGRPVPARIERELASGRRDRAVDLPMPPRAASARPAATCRNRAPRTASRFARKCMHTNTSRSRAARWSTRAAWSTASRAEETHPPADADRRLQLAETPQPARSCTRLDLLAPDAPLISRALFRGRRADRTAPGASPGCRLAPT